MANLAKLVVNLEAQTAKYQRELEKANRKLDRFARNQKRQLAQISNAFKAIGIAIATAFSVKAINAIRRLTIEAAANADALGKQADILGFTTEKLAAYQLAARLSGSSNQGLEKGIKKLSKSIVDATNGLTTYTRAFDALKLSPSELKRLSPDQQFEKVAQAFSNLTTQTEKVSVAYDLFGGRNTQLIKLMELVGDEMSKLEDDTKRWGLAITRIDAAKIEDARDAYERAGTAVDGLATQLAIKLAPVVTDIADRFSNAISASDGFFATIGAFIAQGTNDLKKRADDLRGEIELLTNSSQFQFGTGKAKEDLDARLALLAAELSFTQDVLNQQKRIEEQLQQQALLIEELTLPEATERDDFLKVALERAGERLDALAERFRTTYATVEQEVAKKLEDFDLVAHMFPDDERDRIRAAIRDALNVEELEEEAFAPLERKTDKFFKDLIDKSKEVDDTWKDLGLTFESAFEDAIVEGRKLSDVLKGLLQDILRIIVRKTITEPLGNAVAGFFSDTFGGARADGGPVSPGKTFLVGERGPEFFTPSRSGHIVPMGAGGGAVSYTISIDSRSDRAQIMTEMGPLLERTVQITENRLRRDKDIGRF